MNVERRRTAILGLLLLGLRCQCLRFGGKGRLSPGRQLVATDAPAPGACPP